MGTGYPPKKSPPPIQNLPDLWDAVRDFCDVDDQNSDPVDDAASTSSSESASESASASVSEYVPAGVHDASCSSASLSERVVQRKPRTRAHKKAKHGIRGRGKGRVGDRRVDHVQQLLATELPHVPKKTVRKYAKSLVAHGYDTTEALKEASVQDLVDAGMPKGHAAQAEGGWDSDSAGSGSESSSGSASNSGSGSEPGSGSDSSL